MTNINYVYWFMIGIIFTLGIGVAIDLIPDSKPVHPSPEQFQGNDIVRVSNTDLEMINDGFLSNTNEIAYCLDGHTRISSSGNTIYTIDDVYGADIVNSSPTHVSFYNCGELGNVHSHPSGTCDPSNQDYYHAGSQDQRVFGIWCGDFRYSFFTVDSLNEPVNVVVQ